MLNTCHLLFCINDVHTFHVLPKEELLCSCFAQVEEKVAIHKERSLYYEHFLST
jgi:hypothetical protein